MNRPTILLALLAASSNCLAAEMNCARAMNATERAVCASDDLRHADEKLSFVYGKLLSASPQQRPALHTAQLSWLKTRDQCGADVACIGDRYRTRTIALQRQLVSAIAYRPDDQDMAALAELRALVDAARPQNSAFALEAALSELRIKAGVTHFDNVWSDGDGVATFPSEQPKGVTPDEWNALQASHVDGGGENGTASYTLIDLNGDGQRDLVVDCYSGGTGLWSVVSVLRRKGNLFEGHYATNDGDISVAGSTSDGTGQSSIYSINGRGANQSADWIRLRGRVYVAYRDGHYGEDDVYLIRPFTVIGGVPKLTVRYRYRLSVPVVQQHDAGQPATTLDEQTHTALTKALKAVTRGTARDAGSDRPLCPIPPTVTGDDRYDYISYGPGYYAYEIVGDMPIQIGQTCYIGRMVDGFGQYGKNGLDAQIWMRRPGIADSSSEQTFTVHGIRDVIQTEMSTDKLPGADGA